MELQPTYLMISRSTCLTIRLGLSPTLFLESPIASEAFDLEVRMSHDSAWAQSDVVSQIPCRKRSFQS
nr:hypothetical protein CFP56_19767 [Quercus suber]